MMVQWTLHDDDGSLDDVEQSDEDNSDQNLETQRLDHVGSKDLGMFMDLKGPKDLWDRWSRAEEDPVILGEETLTRLKTCRMERNRTSYILKQFMLMQ